MEVISLKLDGELLKEMDRLLSKYRYSTRTEFIRDAIRQKLSDLEKEHLLKAVERLSGSSKTKTGNKKLHEIREKVFSDLERKFNLK